MFMQKYNKIAKLQDTQIGFYSITYTPEFVNIKNENFYQFCSKSEFPK